MRGRQQAIGRACAEMAVVWKDDIGGQEVESKGEDGWKENSLSGVSLIIEA